MHYRVIYSERARLDLINIERYISDAGSPANAKRYVEAIVAKCNASELLPIKERAAIICCPAFAPLGFAVE